MLEQKIISLYNEILNIPQAHERYQTEKHFVLPLKAVRVTMNRKVPINPLGYIHPDNIYFSEDEQGDWWAMPIDASWSILPIMIVVGSTEPVKYAYDINRRSRENEVLSTAKCTKEGSIWQLKETGCINYK